VLPTMNHEGYGTAKAFADRYRKLHLPRSLPPSEMPCYAAVMALKPRVVIVGPGRLGSALAVQLKRAGYRINEIVSRNSRTSARKAHALSRKVQASWSGATPCLEADLIWFCVPDRQIAKAARRLAHATNWKGKIAFHSSGALTSDELHILRRSGAIVASVHPFMTFVHASIPPLQDVPFALEGDPAALRLAGKIVRDLGGQPFSISKTKKSVYHAWGGFTSPLLIALLVTAEKVARAAGLSRPDARKKMLPIVRQNDVAVKYTSWSLAFILPDTTLAGAHNLVDKLRRAASGLRPPWDSTQITLSAGIVEAVAKHEYDSEDIVTDLINRAEFSIEEARKRGLIYFFSRQFRFTPAMRTDSSREVPGGIT